jgi:hypothetical protein
MHNKSLLISTIDTLKGNAMATEWSFSRLFVIRVFDIIWQ